MRQILLFCFLITGTLFSCDGRSVFSGIYSDTIVYDQNSDADVSGKLPIDICPGIYSENNLNLYPAPKKVYGTEKQIEIKNPKFSFISDSKTGEFFNEFEKFYLKNRADIKESMTELTIHTFPGIENLSVRCNTDFKIKEGSYYLKIIKNGDGALVYVVADDEDGFYNGAKTVANLIFRNSLYETSVFDYPEVRYRGVAEAFYGKPWSREDRMDTLTYLAILKYNMFLYSPKSDPYAWAMWRTPFDREEEEKLREIASHSKKLGIMPCYGIGPGYDIKFSNNKDYSALLYKYRKLISYGFDRCLVLAFDDTQKSLSDTDREKFSDMAEAQIYLAKRLYEDLKKIKPDILLAFVPNDYTTNWAKADTYLSKIAQGLGKFYELAWTGSEVVSPAITLTDLEEIKSIISKVPILADNYPVCDIMFNGGAAFLGPITGREPSIFKELQMYASNPMRYAISNVIPLGTIADMLWDPENYESENSFNNSIRFFSRDGRAKDVYEFATNLRSSLVSQNESPELRQTIDNFLKEYGSCDSRYYG
ncbi:MAG: protein O-GlcNAcase, partial [Deltaproteobacteria bacterium]|nr:protein O-GlcNAcase [Deltaproteobacteria bacterium]